MRKDHDIEIDPALLGPPPPQGDGVKLSHTVPGYVSYGAPEVRVGGQWERAVLRSAESWAVLGLLKISESPGSDDAVRAAIECYDHAIRLSTDDARTRAFERVRRSMSDSQQTAAFVSARGV